MSKTLIVNDIAYIWIICDMNNRQVGLKVHQKRQ
jgi:hypothetical protein